MNSFAGKLCILFVVTTPMLERGKDTQTPFAIACDRHDSVSLGSNGNLGAPVHDENSLSANDKFLEVSGSYLNRGAMAQREQIESKIS